MRRFSSWLIVVAALFGGAQVVQADARRCVREDVSPPPVRRDGLTGKPLYAAARAALVRESRNVGLATPEETRELVDLFYAAMCDRQMIETDRVSTRLALRNRLLSIERGLKSQVKAAVKAERRTTKRSSESAAQSASTAAKSARGGASGASGGGAIADNARQLIELIERTISPDSWATNGGEGTIVYYAPLQVLVVRNTAEVHEGIGGALGAGRP